jgi:general secretion pathway protein F
MPTSPPGRERRGDRDRTLITEGSGEVTATAYSYRAMRRDGRIEKGTLAADSRGAALFALERKGLLALDVLETDTVRIRRRAINTPDLALGLRMLADLLEAGLPVSRALQAVRDLAAPSWLPLLDYLNQAIREGKTLGTAFRDAPIEVPPLVVGMTLAGELAGDVGGAIRRAADITEAAAETRAALRGALAYPIVLAFAGGGAIAIMVGVVIPRFAAILADIGQQLPRSTTLVLTAASSARTAFLPGVVIAITLAALIRAWTATDAGLRSWHALLLRLPLVGTVRAAGATARMTFTLATLLETGVPLRQAMRLAARASGDAAVASRVDAASARIESGQGIGSALRETGALTTIATRLVRAGEESGRLPSLLKHAAKLEQRRADQILRTTVRLLEPALILVFAGVVAMVAAALLQAVYSVRPVS